MNSIRTIRSVSRSYKHAKRYREILGILIKNGFGYLFDNRRFVLPERWSKTAAPLDDEANGRRIVNTLTELGPTFVKFGQMLSCRPDLLPEEIIRALSRLQTEVPAFPYEMAVQVLEMELGKPLAELFRKFPDEPSGAASVAQGYRAVLADGREVFVKIQRPGIVSRIQIDLDILSMLAERLEDSIPEFEIIRPVQIVEDFKDGFLKELDFLNEAANMRAFGMQFSPDDDVLIPEPVSGYCTKRVLTMTCINGLPIRNVAEIRQNGIDCRKLAELGVRLLQKQIFECGFFHGDPHPGNMFVLSGPKIAYVDFGVMGRLTTRERGLLRKIAVAMFWGDMHEMARYAAALSEAPEEVDTDALERELSTLVAAHLHGQVNELNVVQFILDLHQLCYRRKLRLAPHLFRMVRAMGYADAMGRTLVPDFNIMALLRPYIIKQSMDEINPLKKTRELLRYAGEWTELFRNAPHLAGQILERLRDGTLTIRKDQPDVRKLADSIRFGARCIADALLIAALTGTGTLLVIFYTPPLPGIIVWTAAGILLLHYFFRKDGSR